LLLVTSGALAAVVELAEGLEIDAGRMQANLGATRGLIMAEAVTMALAGKIGKSAAHQLVEAASRQAVASSRSLQDVLTGDPGVAGDPGVTAHLDAAAIAQLFDPMAYQGASQALIDRLLASLDGPPDSGESRCR
jgi:3-carboxy-cis,cis-muconate cycloisomerase